MSENTNGKKIEGPCEEGPLLESTLRTNSEEYNKGTNTLQMVHEYYNTARNYATIIKAFEEGRAHDISDVPKHTGKPCIILGSGPSLDDSIKHLKNWKHGIICTTSQALTLMHYDIEPTYILVLDPFCCWDEIKGVDWSKTKTKLIAHPGIWNDLIENWPNEFLFYLENNGRPNSFYEDIQKKMYSFKTGDDKRKPVFNFYIKTSISIFGCSPPMQLFCADILGYDTMFLCGCDFAYHDDKERFTNWDIDENGEWVSHFHPFIPDDKVVYTNNILPTHTIHLFYKKNMMSAWRLCGKTVFTTDDGAITEMPRFDIRDVVARQGFGFPHQSPIYIREITDSYLQSLDAYVIEVGDGSKTFIETSNPDFDLPSFMMKQLSQYFCDNKDCRIMLNSNDYNNHDGEPCPKCGKGRLRHAVPVDIRENMDRIRAHYPKRK